MTRRAAPTTAEVARVVAGAIRGGMPAGSFIVEAVDGMVRLLPTNGIAALPSPADDGWDKALTKWRRSA